MEMEAEMEEEEKVGVVLMEVEKGADSYTDNYLHHHNTNIIVYRSHIHRLRHN
jgi:hypothetical protein